MTVLLKLLVVAMIILSFYMFNRCNNQLRNFIAMIGFSFLIAFLASCPHSP